MTDTPDEATPDGSAPPPPRAAPPPEVQPTPPPPDPGVGGHPKSKVTAGILGIFLGGLGFHRFYLGFTKLGLIMLLISVLSVGILAPFVMIWGLVEGILILTGGIDRDARGVRLT